jgi:cytochrome bd-type quinol oxidase subunit 1
MPKLLILLLVGLLVYGIFVGIFYTISVPVLQVSIFKSSPDAARLVWMVILGVPAVLTAWVMREVYEILFGRSGRHRR